MTVVLDTNVMIRMFGKESPLRRLVEAISYGEIQEALSPAIWLEYEEVCLRMRSPGHWEKLQKLFHFVSQLAEYDHSHDSRFPGFRRSRLILMTMPLLIVRSRLMQTLC